MTISAEPRTKYRFFPLWKTRHSLGETFPLRAIARGGDWCEGLGDARAAWDVVLDILGKRKARREYERIREKLSRGEADREELLRFREVARLLKSSPAEKAK
jgi:DNA primase